MDNEEVSKFVLAEDERNFIKTILDIEEKFFKIANSGAKIKTENPTYLISRKCY